MTDATAAARPAMIAISGAEGVRVAAAVDVVLFPTNIVLWAMLRGRRLGC